MKDLWVDAVVAVPVAALTVAGAVGEVLAATTPTPPMAGAVAIAVLAAVPLVGRRRWPALSALAAFVVAASYLPLGYFGWAPILPLFISCFSLAAYARTRWGLIGALAISVGAYVVPVALGTEWLTWTQPGVWAPAIGLGWISLLGGSARARRIASESQLRQTAETADARARQRIADDRLQVARELHDVLAHTISVIAVQSGLALDSLDDDPETARTAMATVRTSTKEALAELRATLTVLRGLGGPSLPQPRLAQLPDLVAQASSAGLRVTLSGDPLDSSAGGPAVSPVVELTVYRVIQEALTNVLRHARAARADVSVCVVEGFLHVSVVDDGVGGAPGADDGFGLRGMRERVEAVGGTFTAGPQAPRGFAVRAAVPL
jgi:signal transduction histidine kinase